MPTDAFAQPEPPMLPAIGYKANEEDHAKLRLDALVVAQTQTGNLAETLSKARMYARFLIYGK